MLSRTVRSALAIMAVALMVISVPVNVLAAPFGGVVNRAKVDNKTNTLGEAKVELFNYADISTSGSSPVIQSGGLKHTDRHLSLPTKPSETPHNATVPGYLYNKNISVPGAKPDGALSSVLAQIMNGDIYNNKNWTGVPDPTGQQIDTTAGKITPNLNINTGGNNNNSFVLTTNPAGTLPAISARTNDSTPSLDKPAGVVTITPQNKDATMTLVPPTGAKTITSLVSNGTSTLRKPTGVVDNLIRNFAGAMTHLAPAGAHLIMPLAVNLTPTLVQPAGVPSGISGTYYIGNITIDANQSGTPQSVLYLCEVDTLANGIYDQLYLSIEDEVFNEGPLADNIVDWGAPPGGNSNDEMIVGVSDLILGNAFAPTWTVAFVPTPGQVDIDVTLTSKEWYTGNFLVDADGDLVVDDTVYFSAYDEDSNGDFEATDLSVGDQTFGQGTLVDGSITVGNDETLNITQKAGPLGPDKQGYTWNNNATYNWIEINSTGTSMDLGDESVATVDLPFDFKYYNKTFNQTLICANGFIVFNTTGINKNFCGLPTAVPKKNDNFWGPLCFLTMDLDQTVGGQNYYDTVGTAPHRAFVVEFQDVPNWNSNNNPKTGELILYEETNIIKMQWKDLPDTLVAVGIESLNGTTGIGDGGAGDLRIKPTDLKDNLSYEFYPPGSVVRDQVTLGTYIFKVLRAPNPSVSAFTINVTSSNWFINHFPFDGNQTGSPVNTLYYALGDTDSNGIYDRIDLSFNGTFGLGNLNNNIVNLTNGERYNWPIMPVTLTIGPSLPFTLDFDRDPAADVSDVRITATRYYTGSFKVDSDDSGAVDDTYYYVLVDQDSNGVYESIDVSYNDNTFGQGNLGDKIVVVNNDERYLWAEDLRLGSDIYFNISTNGAPTLGVADFTVTNDWTYKGNISFDANLDGKMDESLYFIISDTNTDGIYETMDLSFDPIFGEGILNDGLVTAKPYNDERITSDSDVQLGQGLNFFVSFDKDPQKDASDVRIKIKVWFEGTFMIDAANSGVANNKLYYVLSDTNSDGFMDTMDLSLGDNTYGEGNLADGTLAATNDERITKETTITVGSLHYAANFTGSPLGIKNDGWLKNTDIYSGNFKVDLGINGTAQDTVNFVLSDTNADGLYDTIDLSLGDGVYRQDLSHDGYVDVDNNDETMTASGDVRIGPFVYDLTFVWDPFSVTKAVKLTSKQWYLGNFMMDVDGDGIANETIYFLISDLDSNGIYDAMDLSLGDKDFRQGTLDDKVLAQGNDEAITQTTVLSTGVQQMEARFTPSPNQNIEDAFMKNVRWFGGTFEGSGWSLYYTACDKNSDGVYDTMELSTNPNFGEGDNNDQYVQASNDEILYNGKTVIYASMHYKVFINATMGGTQDVGLTSLEWRTGRWTVEGLSRTVAVSDANSDGVLDTIHVDLNDDGSYDGLSDITGGMDGIKGSLIMKYIVASSNDDGTQIEVVPQNATLGSTNSWMVGYVVIDGTNVGLVVCDHNGDGIYETVDMDLTGDGIVDSTGLTVTDIASAQVNGKGYRVVEISRDGTWIRLLSYTDALVGSAVDRSVSGTLYFGKVSESSVGLDLNSNGKMTDNLSAMVVDLSTTGSVIDRTAVYLDTNLNGDLTDEEPLMMGAIFDMGNTQWKVDNIASDRKEIGLQRISGAIATTTTAPDGTFSLTPSDGTYWVRISSTQTGWGYKLVEDTNNHKGYMVSGSGITKKELTLTQIGTAMSGHVTDMITGEPLQGVIVTIYNSEGKKVVSTQTLADGTYMLGVQRNMVYDVSFALSGYSTDDGTLDNGTWHGVAVGAGRDDINVALMPIPAPDILTFTEPAEGAVVSGTVTVKVSVAETVKVDKVLLTVNDGITWTEMSGSGTQYTYSWNSKLGPDGTYKLSARAVNDVGLRVDKPLTLKVDNGGPIVSFTTAKEQYGSVELAVKASDEFSEVKSVEVRVDGGAWKTMSKGSGGYYYIWSSGPFDSGTHKYEVRATDSRGNVATYKSTVQVDNTWMLLLIVMVVMLVILAIVVVKKKKKAAPVTGVPPQGVTQ